MTGLIDVIPAKAGIQSLGGLDCRIKSGNDRRKGGSGLPGQAWQ
jgi:hypothetical protein